MAKELMSKAYEPAEVEKRLYRFWLSEGYFEPGETDRTDTFTVVIPPPNVTGSLHMGHALNNTLQDIMVRKRRMEGFRTLWLPGTDHAGIATQNVVEQELAKGGLTKEALGRDKFVERVWEWKEKYGNTIIEQLKRLGCSCDWSRLRFTMDEAYSQSVREVFVRLYREDLIYKGNYLVNWCPRCRTALSDIEVEHHDLDGHLWFIKYPFDNGSDSLTIATTRPETLLGDTAVAVNPDDSRYRNLVGKDLILPVLHRRIPVIADGFVDPEFGTGAVKVTPAHDPNDFEIGQRHDLEQINVLTEEGRINENGGPYAGLDRYECRKRLVKDLEAEGLIEKVEKYGSAVGHCYRCDTVVEPYLSEQWFVKMKDLAGPAIEAVKTGQVRYVPKRWEKIYFEWMENIRDWCISRQLWWGHQVPAWYCEACDHVTVEVEAPSACGACGGRVNQDPDVLDTWFSSALWPFATLGWPEETEDLARFYPTSLLSTSFDIIYFWVARMIMSGLHFTGEAPFDTVYIHALIRDADGKKMSKSRGNVIDPLEVIDVFGTDALRFTLAALAAPGRDVFLSDERTQGYRNFMNKIWNASRFILMNCEAAEDDLVRLDFAGLGANELSDRWILSRYTRLVEQVNSEMELFAFNKAARLLYDFFWGDFCDWYIELAKPRLYGSGNGETGRSGDDALQTLATVLEGSLRLLHPFAPFLTEEIWQKLPVEKQEQSIMTSAWPVPPAGLGDSDAEREMGVIEEVTTAARSLRSQFKIPPTERIELSLAVNDSRKESVLRSYEHYLADLVKAEVSFMAGGSERPKPAAVATVPGVQVFVLLSSLDIDSEINRFEKELAELDSELEKTLKKLGTPQFVDKAPPAVVDKERERKTAFEDRRAKVAAQLDALRGEKN
ncbi:MAG: valine--tRNA ligase [Terriglobia bacterium]